MTNIAFLKQINYIIAIRLLAMTSQIIVVFFVNYMLKITMPIMDIMIINLILVIITIITIIRSQYLNKNGGSISLFLQLIIDLMAFTSVLYLTGGSANPFIIFFILQLIVASIILEQKLLWSFVFIVISCYSLLYFYNIPINYMDHYHIENYFKFHLKGSWLSFCSFSIIVAYIVVKLNNTIKMQDKEINKNDQIVELGTMAVSAAHEISTPLSTIAILINDLQQDLVHDKSISQTLDIIKGQIDNCKLVLSSMRESTSRPKRKIMSIYIKQIISKMVAIDPKLTVCVNIDESLERIDITTDQIIERIIIAPLVNAMQAAKTRVDIDVSFDMMSKNIKITIEDDGDGLSLDAIKSKGKVFFTTKSDGNGLGIFLTQSMIARLDGSFSLNNRANNPGCRAEMIFSLKKYLYG